MSHTAKAGCSPSLRASGSWKDRPVSEFDGKHTLSHQPMTYERVKGSYPRGSRKRSMVSEQWAAPHVHSLGEGQ